MLRRTFTDRAEYERAWNASIPQSKAIPSRIPEIAAFVASGLAPSGFRLLHNGGLPLLARNRGDLKDEVVFAAASSPSEFSVRFHLNHGRVGQVRARFWRPSTRAPKTIASGDIGLLEPEPVQAIWSSEGHARTADAILTIMTDHVLPWLDLFDDPELLRERLIEEVVPLVDLSTAVEIMLAEFDVREARRFLRSKMAAAWPPAVPQQQAGFELQDNRIDAIAAYYRL